MTKVGGITTLTVFVQAGDDVVDSLLPMDGDGMKSALGLQDIISERHPGYQVALIREAPRPCRQLLEQLERAIDESHSSLADEPELASRSLIAAQPDVVVLSLSADLDTPPEEYRTAMPRVVRLLKDTTDTRIIIFNCSSVDPSDTTSNYHARPDPPSLQAHRLNQLLLELSVLEGVSIIDADRVIAELGGARHVQGSLLGYSSEACEALGREFARVLEDYGFFEERPILPQVGAREVAA